MRIAIDTRCLAGSRELKGVSQYTRHLTSGLLKRAGADVSFLLFPGFNHARNRTVCGFFPDLLASARCIWSTVPMQIMERLWHFGWPPIEFITGRIDVFFEPNFFLPPLGKARSAVTVHDLSFYRHPEWFPEGVASGRVKKMGKTLRAADHVIAVSHFTADEIKDVWPQHSGKISVIHEAAGPEFQPAGPDRLAELTGKYNLQDPFFLYTGTIEARKNVEKLISAFMYLRRSGGTKCQLILAGSPGYGAETILAAAAQGIEKGWIRVMGFLNQDDLPSMYSSAEGFCYLSRYEGFGLPPLEALACGTPVLVSDIPVFREILGPRGYFANPANENEISEGLVRLEKTDRFTADECIAWASQYSWERAASETFSVFRMIA
jgi:alpha-1,3-rhamnosyl/mannosyltransferase